MDKLAPGIYTATATDWRVQDINGKVAVQIRFNLKLEAGQSRSLDWTGWMTTPKAKQVALKALAACGWRDTNLVSFAEGRAGAALDPGREVSLTVINETSTKDGKEYTKVQWVNPAGFEPNLSPELASRVKGLNLDAELAAVGATPGAKAAAADGQCDADEDDLPF